ncbi:DUF169 domain-containing protein [Actinocrispum wychmicini]|uniref:Uncharacterized protein (DUF169 family) n=1 Tax=Actinocrispum wychmicini TaxID=1213861 RepID=A0A4R2JYV5_9PSEU|nr:DUF169 domain-containing protein [Actinocrispum wychmicini]TCO59295.1 uncharacterized protein (DUF169 family) [Actinocrispum wychmicini]
MDRSSIAERISTALALNTAPVALTFTDTPPAGVPAPAHPVASTCAFWRMAEQGVFYATAEEHFNCVLGAMVMGFALPEQQQQELGAVVTTACDCNYLDAAEPAKIPTNTKASTGILYGPLTDLPIDPDVVVLWLTPRQAMLYNEAAGSASWTTTDAPRANGRPACAALPTAMSSHTATISLGCMGMRTYTEISDDRLLAAIPGTELETFTDSLNTIATANQKMQTYYEGRKAEVAATV